MGELLAVPVFLADRPDKATDFNDLHQLAGADAVKARIDAATQIVAIHPNDAGATGQLDTWPELQPLIVQIDQQEYPLDALPDVVRCAVQEVAGFVKAPIPLIAQSALTAPSLTIQAHTDVERAEKLSGRAAFSCWPLPIAANVNQAVTAISPRPYATLKNASMKKPSP